MTKTSSTGRHHGQMSPLLRGMRGRTSHRMDNRANQIPVAFIIDLVENEHKRKKVTA